jgi:hypothetical protein
MYVTPLIINELSIPHKKDTIWNSAGWTESDDGDAPRR